MKNHHTTQTRQDKLQGKSTEYETAILRRYMLKSLHWNNTSTPAVLTDPSTYDTYCTAVHMGLSCASDMCTIIIGAILQNDSPDVAALLVDYSNTNANLNAERGPNTNPNLNANGRFSDRPMPL